MGKGEGDFRSAEPTDNAGDAQAVLTTYEKQLKGPMDARVPALIIDWLERRIAA